MWKLNILTPKGTSLAQNTSNKRRAVTIHLPVWLVGEPKKTKTRNSAVAVKPARRVYRSVKVTKHSTIPYVRYSLILCNSNFVFTIFDFKNGVNLKSGSEVTQGHWKWYHSIDLVWFPMFCRNSVRNMHHFWDIRLPKCRDLENRVRGPSRSLEMTPCDRAHTNSYSRSIVTMALSRIVSEIFNVEKCRELEIAVSGHSRSLKVVPFDRLCMVSY